MAYVDSYQYFFVSIPQIDPIRFPLQPLGKGNFLLHKKFFWQFFSPATGMTSLSELWKYFGSKWRWPFPDITRRKGDLFE